jgi:hypothetical protein
MTDEMVWALREKHRKGAKVHHMAADYGIPRRVIAAVTGGECGKHSYWPTADIWQVRELLCHGYGMDEIAAAFGVRRKTIANVVYKHGDLFRAIDRRG